MCVIDLSFTDAQTQETLKLIKAALLRLGARLTGRLLRHPQGLMSATLKHRVDVVYKYATVEDENRRKNKKVPMLKIMILNRNSTPNMNVEL